MVENKFSIKSKIDEILNKALDGKPISKKDALSLIKVNDIEFLYEILKASYEICKKKFNNTVFAYGFLYFSTYCRNDCAFCNYRSSNTLPARYRKSPEEIVEEASRMKKSGLHLIDLTMGEDPVVYKMGGWSSLFETIKKVKDEVGIPIMVSPGAIFHEQISSLRSTGADWLAVYQETYNRLLFKKLRINQDFDYRLKVKRIAKKYGFLIEDGILIGVGESEQDWVEAIYSMKDLGVHQMREMGLVPQKNTPMQNFISPSMLDEMKVIALMRLISPHALIPASFDVDGVKGLQLRIMAGANVVTSLIPPKSGLVGVANANLDIDSGVRTLEGVTPYLSKIGKCVASLDYYLNWMEEAKKNQH